MSDSDDDAGGVELAIDGYVCPVEYINDFTPMDFEELVENFKKFDEDGSKSIDPLEMGHLLESLDLPHDEATVSDLLRIADEDGSGEVDFPEFVKVDVNIK